MESIRQIMTILQRAIPAPGEWWPADTKFEILVGAVLVQNTTWTNIENALTNLRALDLLTPEALAAAGPAAVHEAIRLSGYWRTKTVYLQTITDWFLTTDALAETMSDEQLRASLLDVKGVGEETADDIALYAYHRGVFIYDTYARRLLAAAGWGDYTTYAQARKACDERIRSEALSVEEYGLLHGLIVQAGKEARTAGGWQIYWPAITGT